MKKQAFTLAEVLITLAIIGVVAAISIPSVVANTQQKEFQTGLRKAVSVLNSAITMNMAIDGESPYENNNMYTYFQRHMSVMRSLAITPWFKNATDSSYNASFYTTDGMRFEFTGSNNMKHYLYEDPNIKLRAPGQWNSTYVNGIHVVDANSIRTKNDPNQGKCGSYGLSSNTDSTVNAPCLVIVDVNGDRKPFPNNASCYNNTCAVENIRKYGDANGTKLSDTFTIMITDKQAIPYGVVAQRAMYQAQSKEKNK